MMIIIPHGSLMTKDDEINMTFLGFLIFFDPIKSDVIQSISNLKRLGIRLKIISGDNRYVVSLCRTADRTIKSSVFLQDLIYIT